MVKTLLIIVEGTKDYFSLFSDVKTIQYQNERGETVEEELKVDQAEWEDVHLCSYTDSGVVVDLRAAKWPIYKSPQFEHRTIKPDYILIRSPVRGLPGSDFRNLLYGLAHNGTPTLNSVESILWNLDRPLCYAGLYAIYKRLGREKFPLIPQCYYPNYNEVKFNPECPVVVKVGHVHAGYGKMLVENIQDFKDLTGILALHNDYCTTEPYLNVDYDIRIQKIGKHYRAYKRKGSAGWKVNRGSENLQSIEVTEQYKLWADECSKMFGGMDILAVDAVHSLDDGKEYIIECNDSSISLGPQHEEEDLQHIKEGKKREDRLMDPPTSFKKLEVDLINTENAKIELEKKLREVQNLLSNYHKAKRQEKSEETKEIIKVVGGSSAVGITLGVFLGLLIAKWKYNL